MAFVIEKANKIKQNMPEGNYVVIKGIEYRIEEITISASGRVCVKYRDPIRKDYGILNICSIEELVTTVEGVTYKEY
jgi:hypothetical protein